MKNLSIVTVVYNEKDGIKYTLECIKDLKNKIDFEYIIIDGCSDDGTIDVIKKYSDIVDKFISEKDNGIYDAMNKGICMASGEYVGLLNAGDTYEMQTIIRIYNNFENGEYDLIYGALNVLDEERNLILVKEALKPKKMFFCGPNNLNHPTFFIKEQVYREMDFYSIDYDTASDFEFLYNVYLNGYSFYNTNEVHTNFIKGGASYKKSPYQKIRIYKKYFGNKPFWSLLSIAKLIFIKYPLSQVIRFLPNKFHYKYMSLKQKLFR